MYLCMYVFGMQPRYVGVRLRLWIKSESRHADLVGHIPCNHKILKRFVMILSTKLLTSIATISHLLIFAPPDSQHTMMLAIYLRF